MPRNHQAEDFTEEMDVVQASNEEGDKGSSDNALCQIRTAIVPCSAEATPQQLHQTLEKAQRLLFDLGTHKSKKRHGQKGTALSNNDLALALQEDTICSCGHKYSMTHCLWINTDIFPLCLDLGIDLHSSECWVSLLSMEDSVKTELFKFIPPAQHQLMTHQNFGDHFGVGISGVHSEMVSDIKTCAATIFGLNAEFFIGGHDQFSQPECCALILSSANSYTKFAPVLFPDGDTGNLDNMLKTSKMVQVVKVSLFDKASLLGLFVLAPKVKAKIWELRETSAGMLAASFI
ncbi:hypothetical protein PAXRUDRAFT_36826 [Paxillus rubicundulus Ve08.2h10]|uniref:Unplaced genomic scaffold scaffold_2285, whole genome shotgun sequence n=1 Tax=Paxillus rubicundulus Ve08.2h10 TaxID=930991 RepID=A0A0D0D0S6_9AGAM|nr:hypothetical protein PAXRUDRAFT_36826 [Paxillus rubicundulus Ve08.2h10]